jgi:RES domain-containing protein
VRVYRIVHPRHVKTPLDGEGSFRYGGRWNSIGTRVAYASSTISLAQLEYLVNLAQEHLPSGLLIAVADMPEEIIDTLADGALPKNWRDVPAPPETGAVGDRFARDAKKAVLSVPSVLVPLGVKAERNYLINPLHPDFTLIKIPKPLPFTYDVRLRLAPRRSAQ